MEESTTYQYILEQAGIKELRDAIFRQGRRRFGPPDEATTARVNGITDLGRLRHLTDRVSEVNDWQQLLAAHGPRPQRFSP